MVLKKHEIEVALHEEHQEIKAGRLKEDSPLDFSEDFVVLCQACRRGDLKVCQEKIQEGTNINARDRFDYTPLILASLCGHFEVVRLLLESGALCERDTFQGERCLYNALNDRIRNLLLSYDYSKSRDPLQPLAGHITSLLDRTVPKTADITLSSDSTSFHLHKFILAARSSYFTKKLAAAPDTTSWKIPTSIPVRSLDIAITALYFGEVKVDLKGSEEDQAILAGVQRLGRQLEIGDLLETALQSDHRLARQRRSDEVERGRNQLQEWFEKRVLGNQMRVDSTKADNVKWDGQNSIFADVLLCADDDEEEVDLETPQSITNGTHTPEPTTRALGIPMSSSWDVISPSRKKQSTIFPAHRAMLLRSEYFEAMFSSQFKEAQPSEHLPVVHIDCSPAVLSIILTYLYTERTPIPIELAIDVLFAADLLFIERLKTQAATIISTLGNGSASIVESDNSRGETDGQEVIDIYRVIRAGWDLRVPRLEEFGARYIAYRLESYIEEDEFEELVKESAARIKERQETDSIELIDDIRHYLSERFRLRFEDAGIDELLEEGDETVDLTVLNQVDRTTSQDTNAAKVSSQAVDDTGPAQPEENFTPALFADHGAGVVRTLDGEVAGDEFAQDAINYRILLEKIDNLLEELQLDG